MSTRRRIIFDVSMARSGGGFTYAVNVIPFLARRLANADILVIVRSEKIARSLPTMENLQVRLMPEVGIVERLRFLAFEAREVARQFGADLYYSASELSPVACPCPKIAAFRNPNLFTPMRLGWPPSQRLRLFALRSFSRYSARTSARVLFVSRDSARWIGDVLGIPDRKRAAIPHGIDPKLWSKATGSNPIGRRFLLSVSSIYRYKNYVRLIEAWTALAKRWPEVPDLVIVGDDQDPIHSHEMRLARARASSLAERIHLVGEVPYAEIGRYYKHAEAFVFPSFLETFGHPLLEAMAAGLPVVAADIGVFREIGGDAALYCAPFDTDSISRSIEQVLRDGDLRGRLVEKGYERVASYSWDRTVDGMVEMFSEVLEESRR